MNLDKKVSFGLPAYKSQFLAQSISSILSQTYPNFELIIINDASPDDLDQVVKSFNDSRIKYVVNKINIGGRNLVNQWNKCLKYATGDYFVLASDDDIYNEMYLERMVALADKYPLTEVLHCRVAVINEKNETTNLTPCCAEYESALTFIWHKICKGRDQFVPEFMFKTLSLKSAGGFVNFPSAWGSDHATSFLLAKNNGVVCSNEVLFKWRLSSLNISGENKFSKNKFLALILYLKWLDLFIQNNNFKGDEELITLIKKGIQDYKNKRLPIILSSKPVFELFILLFKDKFLNNAIQKFWVIKAILIRYKKKIKIN